MEADEGNLGSNCAGLCSFICGTVTGFSSAGLKAMAGEASNRRNVWEPSVYFALGKESFYFAGQDISIHESMDTYGALIWPGVGQHRRGASVRALVCFLIRICVVGNSFVPVFGEQPATSESAGQSGAGDRSRDGPVVSSGLFAG